jgi:hypothetical protein
MRARPTKEASSGAANCGQSWAMFGEDDARAHDGQDPEERAEEGEGRAQQRHLPGAALVGHALVALHLPPGDVVAEHGGGGVAEQEQRVARLPVQPEIALGRLAPEAGEAGRDAVAVAQVAEGHRAG